jgi:hypothetical protein
VTFDHHGGADVAIGETDEEEILGEIDAVGEHPADAEGLDVVGDGEGEGFGGVVNGLEGDGGFAGDGSTEDDGAGVAIDEAGDGDADAEGFVVEGFVEECGGGADEIGGLGDFAADGFVEELAAEVEAAGFDAARGDDESDDVAGGGVDFDGDAWAAAGGGSGGAFAKDAAFDEGSDDVADAIGSLAGAFVEFPAAEAAFAPKDLEKFPFA